MSERIPEYVATEGPPPAAGVVEKDALDDAFGRAFDSLAEEAAEVRQHVCLHPFHVDVSAEFLEAMRSFSFAVDAFTAASDAVELAAEGGSPAAPTRVDADANPAWRAFFIAGAAAQRDWMVAYARSRGWVSTATAIELAPLVKPPATSEEVPDVRA